VQMAEVSFYEILFQKSFLLLYKIPVFPI